MQNIQNIPHPLTKGESEFIAAIRSHGMRLIYEPAPDADTPCRIGLVSIEYNGVFLQVDADSRITGSSYGMLLNAEFARDNLPEDMAYPASITKAAEGGYLIAFRDLPEALGQAETLKEAVEEAERMLETVAADYLRERAIMPMPSEAEPMEHAIAVRVTLAFAIRQSNYEVSAAKEKALFDKVLGATDTK